MDATKLGVEEPATTPARQPKPGGDNEPSFCAAIDRQAKRPPRRAQPASSRSAEMTTSIQRRSSFPFLLLFLNQFLQARKLLRRQMFCLDQTHHQTLG